MKKTSLIIILLINIYTIKAQRENVIQNIVLSSPVIDSVEDDSYSHSCGMIRDLEINCLDDKFIEKKDSLWKKHIRIQSKGAEEIQIVFQKFILSPNAKISFYTDSLRYQYQGAYFIHKPDSSYISNFLHGNYCTITIEIPINELDENQILISQIYHFTESFNDVVKAAADYSCMIDVNCSEGNSWCDQKRSVAIYYFPKANGRIGLCTGTLVNNYRNNFTQYFLTARHCTDDISDWTKVQFCFNYQNSFCNSNDGDDYDYYKVQGAQMIGYCDVSWGDNALLLITEPIPIQYNVYYSGVDITDRSAGDGVTCIHHSDGGAKKITSGKIKYFAGPKWDVYWDNGIIMGGGSGAPVFLNSNKRVIATISGGLNYDCNSNLIHDWVGKTKACVDYSNGIKNALCGSNPTYISYPGIDPIKSCQSTLNLQGEFHSTHEYDATLNGLTIQAGNRITSTATFNSDANYTLTAGNEIVFLPGTHIKPGSNVTAKIAPCSGNLVSCGTHSSIYKNAKNNSEEYNETIENMLHSDIITLFPNPNTGSFTIQTNNFDNIKQIQVINPLGQTIYTVQHPTNNNITLPNGAKGTYFVRITTETESVTRKILVE